MKEVTVVRKMSSGSTSPRIEELKEGTIWFCKAVNLHPSHLLRKHFDDRYQGASLSSLRVKRVELQNYDRKSQMVVLLHSPVFQNDYLLALPENLKFVGEVDVSEGCGTSTHPSSSSSSSSGSGGSSSGSSQASTTSVPVLGSSDTDDEDTESCSDIEEEGEDNVAELVENDLSFVSEWSSSTTDARAVIGA